MPRRTNSLLFWSLILASNNSVISRQTLSHDLMTPSGSRSTQHNILPTPTTPIIKSKCSHNDPFRIFVPPSNPICCLIPLPTAQPGPHPADDLLSFEEWKQRQLALTFAEGQRQSEGISATATSSTTMSDEHGSVPEAAGSTLVPVIDTSDASTVRPHPVVDFIPPIQDRFNYASLDCSARVHGTHKSMKSSNSILSSKKDKYMLAPCSVDKKYVVVELCDEIRVDTVQLANFEFFSGVFKDITITLAQSAHVDGPTSEIMGVYEAKNIRTIQTFHPFKRPHGFHRFIRIEFHTHYGKEYFCPVSLLRVYGLTQMEEWRMEESRREWEARDHPEGLTISSESAHPSALPNPAVVDTGRHLAGENEQAQTQTQEPLATQSTDAPLPNVSPTPGSNVSPSVAGNSGPSGENIATPQSESTLDYVGISSSSASASHISNHTRHLFSALSNITEAHKTSTTDAHTRTNGAKSSRTKVLLSASTGTPVVRPTPIPSPSPSSSGGESIYRTIMNRLDMLERNSTLSLRYVEEQNYSVRQALRRLEEDVGRLTALTGQQQHELQRSMKNVEKKQAEMEKRWDALLDQVNTLAEEVVLEKRLGIAQLCLLTTVLIFMALTRGSRTEAHLLGGVRRRVDSGLGLTRSLHPRNHAQSRPRTSERPLAWARQDRHSTGDTSHHDSGEPPLTPVRPRSPFPSAGPPSGPRGRKISGTEARSPTGQSSRGVRFPQGLYSFPSSRSSSSLAGMRRSHSMSLSTDQLVLFPGIGKRPTTGTKRLARTAHLHEVEVEAQRRRRTQDGSTGGDNDASDRKSSTAANTLALSVYYELSRGDHPPSDGIAQRNPTTTRQALLNLETLDKFESLQRLGQDNGVEWEDTDAEDSSHELAIE